MIELNIVVLFGDQGLENNILLFLALFRSGLLFIGGLLFVRELV